jgi:4-amino-4-deoxy-L-arabinose transferase-like glycosyltransferase
MKSPLRRLLVAAAALVALIAAVFALRRRPARPVEVAAAVNLEPAPLPVEIEPETDIHVPLQRRAWISALTVLSIGLMALGAARMTAADTNVEATNEGLAAFALGALALWGASAITPSLSLGGRGEKYKRRSAWLAAGTAATNKRPIGWIRVASGAGLLVLVAAASDDRFPDLTATLGALGQFVPWCLGIALIGWGLSGSRPRLSRLSRREGAALGLILVTALILRLWGLDQLRILIDEVHVSTSVTYFWSNAYPRLLRPVGSLDPFPRIFAYWVSLSVELFGRNFAALRVVPALLGTTTVGAIYLLGRELFDRRVGLAAAALLATLPPFLHFSRLGIINMADPLFGTLALAFLARALRRGGQGNYVMAGLMLGLTQYFHEAGRLLFPALAIVWLGLLAFPRLRRPPFSRRGALLGLVAMLLVAAPLIYTERTQPEPYESRMAASGQGTLYWNMMLVGNNWTPAITAFRDSALVFTRTPDSSLFYGGMMPLILPVFVPLLLLGLACVCWRRQAWMPLLWLAATIFGNSVLADGQMSVRFIPAFPAVALIMALGLREAATLIAGHRRSALLIGVVVIVVGAAQTYAYFGPHLAYYNRQLRDIGAPDGYDALMRAEALPAYSVVHLISNKPPFSQQYAEQLIRYLTDNVSVRVTATDQVTADYLDNLSRSVPQWFFVEGNHPGVVALLQREFPTVSPPQYTTYVLPGPAFLLYAYTPPSSGVTTNSP